MFGLTDNNASSEPSQAEPIRRYAKARAQERVLGDLQPRVLPNGDRP
jgi:hypothetical protein